MVPGDVPAVEIAIFFDKQIYAANEGMRAIDHRNFLVKGLHRVV